MSDLGVASPEDFESVARTLHEYGPVAIGLLLLLGSFWLARSLKSAADEEHRRLLRKSFWVVLPSGLVLFLFGGFVSTYIQISPYQCVPFDFRMKQADVQVRVSPDSDHTFVTALKQTDSTRTYRIIGVKDGADIRFTITNRLDYYAEGTRLRPGEVRQRSESNQSHFKLEASAMKPSCAEQHLIYNERRDQVLYETGDELRPIEPSFRSDDLALDTNGEAAPFAEFMMRLRLPDLVVAAHAQETSPTPYETLKPVLNQSQSREQWLGVEELAQNFQAYRPMIATGLMSPDLSSSEQFALVSAVRLYLRNQLTESPEGPPTIQPGTTALGPEVDYGLLRQSMFGDRAIRLSARAALRTIPTVETIQQFDHGLDEFAPRAETAVGSPELAMASYMLTGLDIYYNYAINTAEDARTAKTDPETRRSALAEALQALDKAWDLKAQAPSSHGVDFAKAHYGKAIVYTMIAEQIAIGNLPTGVETPTGPVETAAAAVNRAATALKDFTASVEPAERQFYMYPLHIDQAAACPAKAGGGDKETVSALAECLGVDLVDDF